LSELESIPSYYKALKESAYAVDKRMNDGPDLHFTLVHGDFKEANIMIGRGSKEDSFSCAAVDYQYCGRGFGAKDIVMLIVSSVSPQVLKAIGGEDGVIQLYADELKNNLKAMNEMNEEDINTITSFETLKMQYELAMVDYVRFMAG
jgi:Ser/Thr protein kinase RdoA (MazF antagonist)